MLSTTDMIQAFAALQAAGFHLPSHWNTDTEDDLRGIASIWSGMLADVPKEALHAATLTYIRSGAEYWPKPGQLLNMARKAHKGPGLNLHTEFRWLVDAAHTCDGDLHQNGQVLDVHEQFSRELAKRYSSGVPKQLSEAISAFGGVYALKSVHHTRSSDGLRDFTFRLRDFTKTYKEAEQSVEDAKVLRLVDRAKKAIR